MVVVVSGGVTTMWNQHMQSRDEAGLPLVTRLVVVLVSLIVSSGVAVAFEYEILEAEKN